MMRRSSALSENARASRASGGSGRAASAAGIAAALRALVGESPAALAGTAIGALVAVATLLELGGDAARHAIAAAAAAWTIAELARTTLPASSPLVAMLPAGIAAV